MADYVKMLQKLDQATESLVEAEQCLLPADTLKLMDGYLLGYLRCAKMAILDSQKAIRNSSAYKKRKKKDQQPQ